ncbi:hypothetical protein L6164_022415 [Bauhinia variegata]|uniref:Uncharacterized protein n=1 Tax=Bauhinia variegata TaxID=167791 RepID=A0ACB9MGZ4_BAUVA|nr:hypothetical protein L6164_022415 [Bauhinia variegata]
MAQTNTNTVDNPSHSKKDAEPIGLKVPPPALKTASMPSELTHIANFLEDEHQIGFHRDHPPNHGRYAALNCNQLFEALHRLYLDSFNAHWPHFRSLA